MPKEVLHCVFDSFEELTKQEIADLLCYLESIGLLPTKYGQSPTRPKHEYHVHSKNDVADVCCEIGYVSVKGKNFIVEFGVAEHFRKPHRQSLRMTVTKKSDPNHLAQCAITMAKLFKACYAYATLDSHKIGYTPGRSIEDCLFGFAWLNILGQPYVDMWGQERVLQAPAAVSEDQGYIIIKLSDSPLVSAHDIINRSKELQSYFGSQYFFDYALEWRQRTFKSLQEIDMYNKTTLELARYAAPDFHRYYNYCNNDTPLYAIQRGIEDGLDTGDGKDRIIKVI